MSTHLYVATGVLVLKQATPIISAIFDGYSLDLEHPMEHGIYMARIPEDGPTWAQVFDKLIEHARTLSLPLPASDYRAALRALAQRFGVLGDAELNFVIDSIGDFDSDADIEGLFTIATCFDDGHGLEAIEMGGAWCEGAPCTDQLGGHARYISRAVQIHQSSARASSLGKELSHALLRGRLREATELICCEVDEVLSCIHSVEARVAIERQLAKRLKGATKHLNRSGAPSTH